jgi:hypothetical protein
VSSFGSTTYRLPNIVGQKSSVFITVEGNETIWSSHRILNSSVDVVRLFAASGKSLVILRFVLA